MDLRPSERWRMAVGLYQAMGDLNLKADELSFSSMMRTPSYWKVAL